MFGDKLQFFRTVRRFDVGSIATVFYWLKYKKLMKKGLFSITKSEIDNKEVRVGAKINYIEQFET